VDTEHDAYDSRGSRQQLYTHQQGAAQALEVELEHAQRGHSARVAAQRGRHVRLRLENLHRWE
jgi:hypothetical protein